MMTPETLRGPMLDEHLRRLVAKARPEQIRKLLDDIKKSEDDGFPPVQGTA